MSPTVPNQQTAFQNLVPTRPTMQLSHWLTTVSSLSVYMQLLLEPQKTLYYFFTISGHQYESQSDLTQEIVSSVNKASILYLFHSTEPFLLSLQRLWFHFLHTGRGDVFLYLDIYRTKQLIFAHSYKEPNTAAAIAFDQEGVLEILSLALAHAEIKCVSFVSLTDSSFIGMSTHAKYTTYIHYKARQQIIPWPRCLKRASHKTMPCLVRLHPCMSSWFWKISPTHSRVLSRCWNQA